MSQYAQAVSAEADAYGEYVDAYDDGYTIDDLLEGASGVPLMVWLGGGLYAVSLFFAFTPGLHWIPHAYAIVWGLFVLAKGLSHPDYRLRFPVVIWPYVVWVAWSTIGLIGAAMPSLARPNWFMLVRMAGLLWLASNCIRSMKHVRVVLYLVLAAEVAVVAAAWWQLGDLTVMRRWGWERDAVGFGIQNANDLAFVGYFGIAASTLLFFTTGKGRLLERVVQIAGAALSLYVIWASGSRRGMLNVPVFAVLVYFCHLIRRRQASGGEKAAVTLIALLLFVGIGVWMRDAPFAARLATFRDAIRGDLSGVREEPRFHLLLQSIEATIKNPVYGLGPGHFRLYDIEHGHYGGQSPHSDLGAVGSESGFVGLAIYLTFWIAYVVALRRVRRRAPPGRHEAMLNVIYAFVLLLVINLPTQEHYRDRFVWLLLGSFMGYFLTLRNRMDELDNEYEYVDAAYEDGSVESEPAPAAVRY